MVGNHLQDNRRPAKRLGKRLAAIFGGLVVVAVCVVIRSYWGAESASADPPRRTTARNGPARATAARAKRDTSSKAASTNERLRVVAVVNRRQITREELGRECLRHYGNEVLESLVNKHLIAQECRQRGISVTRADVKAEIDRMAKRFGLPTDQWMKMLKEERGINPAQYADDIVWPTLALRRLAGKQLTVTRQELVKAYETKYGPSVRARLIASKDLETAKRLRAEAAADPDAFGNLAKEHSEDTPSAAAKGLIQPIRKHGSYAQIEQAAFNMADGEISEVIQAGGQYVVLKREGLLPGAKFVNFEQVAPQLEEVIRDSKLRKVANEVFKRLQKNAEIQNVLNDPKTSRAMPGVAAVISTHRITIAHLAGECIKRHGVKVLEGTINRKLIELACEKRNITVSQEEIEQEIVRAASVSVKPKPDGSPDVEAWLKLATEKQGVSEDVYRRDSVWPSVALKKLVGDTVEITDDDLRKGYEANYGTMVQCRAIVLKNLRRANKVWEMARENPTVENFGDLAEQYSAESSSRVLRGEVPPIKKHGGQLVLEKEAFTLKPGELSGVIQAGEFYIILFCEGYTKPNEVAFEEVRQYIYEDIHEKKLRLAMAKYFRRLQESATIDNHLAGTTHRPKKPAGRQPPAHLPTPRQGSGK